MGRPQGSVVGADADAISLREPGQRPLPKVNDVHALASSSSWARAAAGWLSVLVDNAVLVDDAAADDAVVDDGADAHEVSAMAMASRDERRRDDGMAAG